MHQNQSKSDPVCWRLLGKYINDKKQKMLYSMHLTRSFPVDRYSLNLPQELFLQT